MIGRGVAKISALPVARHITAKSDGGCVRFTQTRCYRPRQGGFAGAGEGEVGEENEKAGHGCD